MEFMATQFKSHVPIVISILTLLLLFSLTSCRKEGPVVGSEYQKWQENNLAITSLFDTSTEAFYGQYRRIPGSLDELKSSGWLWFYPVVPEYAPDFEIVDRELEEWDADKDKVHFKFTETGYVCYYYIRKTGETTEHQQENIGNSNVKSRYDSHRSFDPEGARYDLYNAGYRRQFLAFNLARHFIRRYYTENNALPGTAPELYNAWFDPMSEAIAAIPIIPEGNPYSVYVGYKGEANRGIMYVEIVRPDRTVYTQQRVFMIEAQGNALTVIETALPEEEFILKEDTIMFLDSSLSNWGML